jgi:hypothetical protein
MGEYTGATAIGGFRGTDRMAELAGSLEWGGGGGPRGKQRGKRRVQVRMEGLKGTD